IPPESPAPTAAAAPTATGTMAAGRVLGRAPIIKDSSVRNDGGMSELWQLGALELAEKIRTKETSIDPVTA
ncbi:unnamed protein product, partial [marine sediment metagenome]